MYKNTRQKLNDMSLQKSGPKKRSSKTTAEGKENATNAVFVLEDFLGGKAGRTSYPILISGGKEYLYKSSKPRHHRNGQHLGKTPSSVRMTVDLHGHSKDEAIEKLNKSLTKWVVKAMKGADPWVIPVDIICRGGNQNVFVYVARGDDNLIHSIAASVWGWIVESTMQSGTKISLLCKQMSPTLLVS